jgi:hypothetical protein
MSVTTGSIGTANIPASNPSLQGLDSVNFFLAAMLAGFGPYVAAYLANENWPQAEIGLVLSAGTSFPAANCWTKFAQNER